jgi:hypothetical protein
MQRHRRDRAQLPFEKLIDDRQGTTIGIERAEKRALQLIRL